MLVVRKEIPLKDGTTISVQASKYHHCWPRADSGPWEEFETSPTVRDEDCDVSGHVKEEEVWSYISQHGGIDLSKLLENLQTVF